MLIPLKGGKWAEISVVVEKEIKEYNLGLVKVVEIDRRPVYALLKDIHDEEEIYYEISKFIASLIKEGKYSRYEIIREVSIVFGIAEEYAEGLLERVMVEMGAIEDEGVVVIP